MFINFRFWNLQWSFQEMIVILYMYYTLAFSIVLIRDVIS